MDNTETDYKIDPNFVQHANFCTYFGFLLMVVDVE